MHFSLLPVQTEEKSMCLDSKTHGFQLKCIQLLHFEINIVFQVDSRYIGFKGLGVAWWWGWCRGWAAWLQLDWRVNSSYRKRYSISLDRFQKTQSSYNKIYQIGIRQKTEIKDDIYLEKESLNMITKNQFLSE